MALREVLADATPRLQAAARAVAEARSRLEDLLEQRDRLIVWAVDGGMAQGRVAAAAGVSRTRVQALLAGSQPADEATG